MLFRSRKICALNQLYGDNSGAVTGEWRERTYTAESTTDWIGVRNGTEPYNNALAPYHGQEVATSTPLMQWPDLGAAHQFEVKFYNAGGTLIRTLTTEQGNNFIIVPFAQLLPPGAVYNWTVRSLTDSTTYPESAQRQFYLLPEARPYAVDVPGASSTLGQRIYDRVLGLNGQTALTRPRILSQDPAVVANMAQSFIRNDVRNEFARWIDTRIPIWESEPDTNETTLIGTNVAGTNHSIIVALAYYWKLGGTTPALAIRARNLAKKRVVMLSTYWNGTSAGFRRGYGTVSSVDQTNSASDYQIQDQKWRSHIIALALGYDLFKIGGGSGNEFSSLEQSRLLEFLDYRIGGPGQGMADLYTARDLQVHQYESHGIGGIGYLAYTCLLLADSDMSGFPTTYGLAGHVPNAVKTLLPLWLTMVQAFRTEDGSSHSGCAYDDFDTISGPLVQMTYQIFGIDLMDKPKYYAAAIWKAYMNGIPHVRTRTQFGDESQEHDPYRASYGALYYRYPSPLNSYIWENIPSSDLLNHALGFIPLRGTVPAAAAPPMLSKVFPSGGYYGSLANFTSPYATSVLMRSSQHGGFNHAHHDMNSIVVWGGNAASGPRQLLIHSGYYAIPNFGSQHNIYWQRASRGHNTLSMDNGAGQQNGSFGDTSIDLLAKGKLIYWKENGDYSCVIGDATQSYTVSGYTLSSFVRAVVHFRDDVILTFDYALSSSGSHTWDWNFHTDNPVAYSGGVFTITSGTATGYVQNLYCSTALATPTAWASGPRSTNGQYNYTGWDGPAGFSGTVSSGTTTSLTVTGATWTTNQYANAWVTVNGVDRLITSNNATTINWATALAGAAAGSFTVADMWAPGPPSSFPPSTKQYHHRISTSATSTEYKAVTAISVGTNGLISSPSVTSDASSITMTATIQGRARSVVFNFINKTLVIT